MGNATSNITNSTIASSGIAQDAVPVEDFEQFKEFLIFRVDALDSASPYHRELADHSDLESAAAGYADLMALSEREPGIHYEVRSAATGGLVHTAEPAPGETPKAASKTINPQTKSARRPRSKRTETTCSRQPNHQSNRPHQLRMAFA